MKQLIKFLLCLTFLSIIFNTVQAEENPNIGPRYDLSKLIPKSVPLLCGETRWIFQTAYEVFGEVPMAGAEIRKQGNPDTPVLGLITFTYNKDTDRGTWMMTIPKIYETCILAYGMNWVFTDDLKKILAEGNESK